MELATSCHGRPNEPRELRGARMKSCRRSFVIIGGKISSPPTSHRWSRHNFGEALFYAPKGQPYVSPGQRPGFAIPEP